VSRMGAMMAICKGFTRQPERNAHRENLARYQQMSKLWPARLRSQYMDQEKKKGKAQ
jgi:hypothetical protein